MIYFCPLKSKKVSWKMRTKSLKKIRTLSLIKILWVIIKKCNVQGFSTNFMQIYAGLDF